MSGNGNGNKTITAQKMTPSQQFRRKARGVDCCRNITAMAKKFNVAPLRQEELIGATVQGKDGEWYAWDELVSKMLMHLEKLINEVKKP